MPDAPDDQTDVKSGEEKPLAKPPTEAKDPVEQKPPAPKLKTVVDDMSARATKVLRVGAQVLYVMASGPSVGESRPAICVRPTDKLCGNLKVDLDGEADAGQEDGEHRDTLSMRVISIPFGSAEEPGTWYWPPA